MDAEGCRDMTRDEMIEAGARALHAEKPKPGCAPERCEWADLMGAWDDIPEDWRKEFRATAELILTAVFPGILKGTHAELPIELTGKMRHAVWVAQYKHSGATDAQAELLARPKMIDPRQIDQDGVAYRAMVAAAIAREAPARDGSAVPIRPFDIPAPVE